MTILISIGINRYLRAPELLYAEEDALSVETTLTRHLDINSTTVLLGSRSGDELATRNNILRSVYELSSTNIEPCILYFAGHGLSSNGLHYICPFDFDPRIPHKSSISLEELIGTAPVGIPWLLIVLDSCRNRVEDVCTSSAILPAPRSPQVDDVYVIASCLYGETAIETPMLGEGAGGLFTYYFLNKISSTKAAHINMHKVFDWARRETSVRAAELDGKQTPHTVHNLTDLYLPRRRLRRRA